MSTSRIEEVHEYGIDMAENAIFLVPDEDVSNDDSPGVDYRMANRFIKNLNLLKGKNIVVHMKTCGGDVSEGMAIYDAIVSHNGFVTIINYNHARSMSSIILQAADHRVMMPNSEFMFHAGSMSFGGTTKQFLTEAKQLKDSHELMLDIYIERLEQSEHWEGKSKKQIRRWLNDQMDKKEEVYLNAYQAVELGFADEVRDYAK